MLTIPGRHRLSLGLWLVLAACKDEDEDVRAPVQAICEATLSCTCRAPAYATVDACIADYAATEDSYKDIAATNGLTFDAACFDAFLEQFEGLGCAVDNPGYNSCNKGCVLMYGDQSFGAACSTYGPYDQFSDCAADLDCFAGKCINDFCAPLSVGTACADADFSRLGFCGDGLYCDLDSLTCKTDKDIGAPCNFDGCKEGLACSVDKTCALPPTEGEACMLECADELRCLDNLCVAPPGEGEACAGLCAEGLQCADSSVCVPSEPLLCGSLFFQ